MAENAQDLSQEELNSLLKPKEENRKILKLVEHHSDIEAANINFFNRLRDYLDREIKLKCHLIYLILNCLLTHPT